ncbi:ferredoxin [Streptomyces sp. NPDC056910]|uniref:Ferredoxin n=1 Tax=Streptomyces aureus TaxID=193461 RepID=A0ABV4SXY6_9ACTN|nr:ferredoxin [Streptomyces sp. CB01635]PJN05482.1 ferredoxin [Streptomyces sp. CB01635]
MTYVVTSPCIDVKDKSCTLVCPVDCIYEGGRMMYIHPDECIECGACEDACPMSAILYSEDIDDGTRGYLTANATFFEEIGSPKGAKKFGPSTRDADIVTRAPAQGGD